MSHDAIIDGSFTCGQIANVIVKEEHYGYIFKDCKPGKDREGVDCNIATFDYFDDDDHPTVCLVQLKGTSAPAGFTLQWSGKMLVASGPVAVDVDLYRKN